MVIVNALKPLGEAQALSLGLPHTWAFGDNLSTVVDDGHYLTGLRNSVLVTIPAIAVVLLLGSMAAWAFARTQSRWLKSPTTSRPFRSCCRRRSSRRSTC